jgi:uncharacterized protein
MPARLQTLVIALCAALLLLVAGPAAAQTFPALTGRVVDDAHILPADAVQRLDQKLAALETQSQRQLVVVTLPDLQGYEISDYGYRLGRAWGIGDKTRNDGAILIVAPKERKVRIEVGYGLEPVLTDGLSALIVQDTILPKFKAGDMPGGIEAGTDAIVKQLTLPADQAQKIAAAAKPQAARQSQGGAPVILFVLIFLFVVLPMIRALFGRRGRAYGGGSGLGPILLWSALDAMTRGGGGRGGGGDWGGGGGGGFSGGGGSFGGGGSSGSW